VSVVDPSEYDRLVLESIDPILAQVRREHLGRPTPCTEWDLDELLRHMVSHHRGFAAATKAGPDGGPAPADPATWQVATLGDDPYLMYRDAAAAVTAAFAEPGVLQRRLEILGYGTFPAKVAMNMHAVDFLAHGWDVAKAIGVPPQLDERLCEVGLRIASGWPDTPKTWGPNGAFRHRIPVAATASAGDRLMGLLGRDPDWTAPPQLDG
jgi:uncharacterized protein (TIGR03086 family)